MSAADLVFGDGDRVVAMGRLVRDGGDWWLDSARVVTMAMRTSGERSQHATKLSSADAHITALQKQNARAARLWLHVIGTWRRGTIPVDAVGFGPGRPDWPDDAGEATDEVAVAQVAASLGTGLHDWGIERLGDKRPVAVELFRVVPEVAAWADAQPDGLVRLDPSVRPVSPR